MSVRPFRFDGRRLAYWRTIPNTGDPNGPTTVANDLRVLEVANPASDRSVLTLTGQTVGGGVVWSNDGQGLLVVTLVAAYSGMAAVIALASGRWCLRLTSLRPTTEAGVIRPRSALS